MGALDVTKKYRLADGRKVESIRRVGSVSVWDNRGGDKACYELVLEDGTVQRDWYYNDLGKRTGEDGPSWEHPNNLILEESYQGSLVDLVCNCGAEQVAFLGYGVQARLRYKPYCIKCGCQYVLEPAYRRAKTVEKKICVEAKVKKQKFETVKMFTTDSMPTWLRNFVHEKCLDDGLGVDGIKNYELYLVGSIVTSARSVKSRYGKVTVALAQKADEWFKKHGAEDSEGVIIKHWAA